MHVVGHDPTYNAADTKIFVHSTFGENLKTPEDPLENQWVFLSIEDPDANFHEDSEYHKLFEV